MNKSDNKKAKLLRDAIHTTFLMHALEDDADIMLKVNIDSYFEDCESSKEFLQGITKNYEFTIRDGEFLPFVLLTDNGDSIVQLSSLQVNLNEL